MLLSDAWAQLEAMLHAGKARWALQGLIPLAHVAPEHAGARLAVAEALWIVGQHDAAAELFANLVRGWAYAGQPMRALLAYKQREALFGPDDALCFEVAQLYSGGLGRPAIGNPVPLPEIHAPFPLKVDDRALVEAARELGAVPGGDGSLPSIPLLSRLPVDDFVALLNGLRLVRLEDGARILEEGVVGDSCFLLADGAVMVSKNVNGQQRVLTRLWPGAVFGEMALVSHRPRSASVTAVGSASALELTRQVVESLSGKLHEALYAFTRQRLLSNLTVTCPLFTPLSRGARLELVNHFGSLPLQPGGVLIHEGQPGDGLYIVVRGAVQVTKNDGEREVMLATLKEGDLFGEISVLRDTPATATVTALQEGEVLFLDKADFRNLVARHPEVQEALSELTDERLRMSSMIMDELAELGDEDLVLLV